MGSIWRRVRRFLEAAWPVLAAYLVAFVLILAGSTVLVVLGAMLRTGGKLDARHLPDAALRFALSAPGILAAAAISGCTFLLVAAVAARILSRDVVAGLRLGPTRARPLGFVAAIAGVVALSVAASSATDLLGVRNTGTMEQIATSLSRPTPLVFTLAILLVGVLPGVAEETFFRGFAQGRLSARLGPLPAVVTAAFLFGLIHLDPVQSPLAFLLGLFLGWAAERLGGIRPSIAAHAVNNTLFVVAACLAGDKATSARNDWREDVIAIAAGTLVLAGASALLASRAAVSPDRGADGEESGTARSKDQEV
jgi:membrane protease YdiL (CAAX protease family)